jgi:hypothetical protein
VQETFGWKQTTMYDGLKAHHFTSKNANPDKQCVRTYEAIMIEVSLKGDSVHPTQDVSVTYGWIKQGKMIETTGARKRLNIIGALNLETSDHQGFETIQAHLSSF